MAQGIASFWAALQGAGNDLDALLAVIARRAAEVVGEASVLTKMSEDGTSLEPVAHYHADPDVRAFTGQVLATQPVRLGEGVAGQAALTRRPVVIADLSAESPIPLSRVAVEFAARYPLHAMLVVPLVAFGRLLGTLGVIRLETRDPYGDEDVLALEALAARAALALAEATRPAGNIGPADYEAIFRQSLDGILLSVPDGRVLAANPAACVILEMSEEQICEQGRAGIIALERDALVALLEQRERAGSVRAELPIRRGDGSTFVGDVSSTIFVTPEGDARASVIFRDVTERVSARQRLEEQHRALELLHEVTSAINAAPDGAAASRDALDAVVRRTGWSAHAWEAPLVREAPDLVRRVLAEAEPLWVAELDPRRAPAGAAAGVVDARSFVGVPIMVGDEARGVMALSSTEVRPRDDELFAVLADIGTQLGRAIEREEAEKERRQFEEARDAFVARAAHELRTPAIAVSVALELLDNSLTGDERATKAFGIMSANAERLRRLIDRLLDLTRLEQGSLALERTVVDAGRVLRDVVDATPPPAGHTVDCRSTEPLPVLADPGALDEILTNLLSNAFRYGGPHVWVDAERADGRVVVRVADDGPGVDIGIEETLFEPFARQQRRGEAGLGLGLSICRGLANAMGGALRYERDASAGGGAFVLELPAAEA